MDVARNAKTLAVALTHSAINFANALGACVGGLAIATGGGLSALGWVGAILGVGGLVLFGLSLAIEQNFARSKALSDE